MTAKEIIDAYCIIRKENSTISDDVLDFMKDSAIAALQPQWIKIESDDDLPKEVSDYWVYDEYDQIFELFFDGYSFVDDYGEEYDNSESITHYMPITKPQPPKD